MNPPIDVAPKGQLRASLCPVALLLLLFGTLGASNALASSTSQETYNALRAAGLDGRTLDATDLVLERDALEIHFESGTLHLLEPVGGITPGAVFLGKASYVVSPASSVERRRIWQHNDREGNGTLSDTFANAVLLFGADTERALAGERTPATGTPNADAERGLAEWRKDQEPDLDLDPFLRLARYWTNDEGLMGAPLFAFIDGATIEDAVLAVDPAGILDGEGVCLMANASSRKEIVFSERLRVSADRPRHRLVNAENYRIDTHVTASNRLEGTTTLRFRVLVPRLEVLPIDLFPDLQIERVALVDSDASVSFRQPSEERQAAIFFDQPLERDAEVALRIAYSGDGILDEDGPKVYQVRGRTNWYPNVGTFDDRATYDLRFRVPEGHTVISVGEHVKNEKKDGEIVSIWKSATPLTVAGFNYGDFEIYEQEEENTGVTLQVFATKGEPDFITEINQNLQSASDGLNFRDQLEVATNDAISGYVNTYTGPSSIGISTEALAEVAMADAVNSIQVFTNLFGPLDSKRLAVTQQSAWSFGQAWPSLVYLPYLPGLSSLLKLELGMDGYAGFVEQVGIHEIAHQWWGHHVGWATYRDQWLSEGFAEFSTALLIELTQGAEAHDEFWEQRRRSVLGKVQGTTLAPYAAGALTLGYRASTAASPYAGRELIYSKGAYILQMLRTLMRDEKSKSDERFFAMMRDFADSWKGRNPSTEDFKAHLQKHMIPELNAAGDGTVDWFFDQWVYGTEVPAYAAEVQIEKAGKNKYRLFGTLSQSGVSDDFMALVPTYIDFGKGKLGKFGRAPFKGNMTQKIDVTLELPKKPKGVLLNGRKEILAFEG